MSLEAFTCEHVIFTSQILRFQSVITHRTSWEFVLYLGFEYSGITKKRKFTWSFLVRCPSQLGYRENSMADLMSAIAIPGMSLVFPFGHYVTNDGLRRIAQDQLPGTES